MIRPVLRAPMPHRHRHRQRRGGPAHFRRRRGRGALLATEILTGGLLISAHFAWGPAPGRVGSGPAAAVAPGNQPAAVAPANQPGAVAPGNQPAVPAAPTGPTLAPVNGTATATVPAATPSAGSSRRAHRADAGPVTAAGPDPTTAPTSLPAARPATVASSAPVSCATDLALASAPDTGYNFLCTQGGVPVSWSTNGIVIYESGLSLVQQAAFAVAVVQWSAAARFQVSYTSSPQVANVTVTGVALGQSQPGYVEDGYTTVSYRCTPGCAYRSARVELSTTADLLQTDWVSTILHELGHVAGLNHVSRVGEVMYPYLTLGSPVLYAPGDLQGLAILAADRGA